MQHKEISPRHVFSAMSQDQDGFWGLCPAPPSDRVSGTDVVVTQLGFRLSFSTALKTGPPSTLGTLEDVEITGDGATSPSTDSFVKVCALFGTVGTSVNDCVCPKAETFVLTSDGLLETEGICGLSSIGVDGFSNDEAPPCAAASAFAISAALLSISCIRFCTIAGISCTYVPIKR